MQGHGRFAVGCLLSVLALGLASGLGASELAPLSSLELHKICVAYARSPESEEGKLCKAYVRGFIEGSQLVHIEPVSVGGETFTERAFRTRVGHARAVTSRYCLDASLTMDAFVIQMLQQAESAPPRNDADAGVLLYGTLARYHSCSA